MRGGKIIILILVVSFVISLTNFVGNGANTAELIKSVVSFIATICYIVPILVVMLREENKDKDLIRAVFIATFVMTIFVAVANYVVIVPFYANFLGITGVSVSKVILWEVIPFNILKGLAIGVIFLIVYKTKKKKGGDIR